MFRLIFFLLFTFSLWPTAVLADTHWSFRKRSQPTVPQFKDSAGKTWVRNGIDAFILDRLRQRKLQPASQASRAVLIRRLSFDLTGLPPSPKDVAAFVNDDSKDAYERLVDKFLASPHYGERWAQHWLDVVRFAESEGFEYDRYLPGMWRYRDYVIRSFNQDKPFDLFLTEQIAGDEIDPNSQTRQIAAGFHRLGPVRRNAGNQKVAFSRNEVLTEMTDAIGSVFLGVTMGCARCHDHEFDDISQQDYYRLQAFLSATYEHNEVLADTKTPEVWKKRNDQLKDRISELKKRISEATGKIKAKLSAKLREMEYALPEPLPTICSVRETPDNRTSIYLLRRGLAHRKTGKPLSPAFPVALNNPEKSKSSDLIKKQPRTALARWLADPDHPLVARVLVNRIWQYHFGTGLVATPNDFGKNGATPTHPELLDHLANEFVRSGMKLKSLHRMIVLSNTYRQASSHTPSTGPNPKAIDPKNRLLWQFPRRRLSAEEIRDAMLVAAGLLNRKQGGKSVVVPVEKDLVNLLYAPSEWKVTADKREHNRRSIYLIAKRNLRLPFGQVFDQPDLQTSCPHRVSSTHSLQALEMLNGKLTNRLAEAFAERLQREAGANPANQVKLAFLLTAGRPPTSKEHQLSVEFLKDQPLR